MNEAILKKIKKLGDTFWIALLLFIAVISHWEWFQFGNVLSFWDSWFLYSESLKELFLRNTWVSGNAMGRINIELYKSLFLSLQSFLGIVGFQYTDAVRITHLMPIALLGYFSPYVLVRYLTRQKSIAFIGALFYGSTIIFTLLQYLGHASITFIVALAPLIIFFFIKSLKKNTTKQWIVFLLIYWVGVSYETRMMYVVTIILGIYFLFFISTLKKYILKIVLVSLLFLGLSAYWIFPILSGSFSVEISDVAGRDLNGSDYYSISQSFSFFNHSWTGEIPTIFNPNPIPWYFWIMPIIVSASFFFRREENKRKSFIFFGVIYAIGLFLTKQAGEPFPGAFQWLRDNVPGFLVFRSCPKFYFVLSLGALGLLSYGLLSIKEKWNNKNKKIILLLFFIIIFSSLLNLKPFISQEIGGMFTKKEIPNDYILLKKYIAKDSNFFRTLWVPKDSRWSFFTNKHPKISSVNISRKEWQEISKTNQKLSLGHQITNIYTKPFANLLLDTSSIKYVIVPLEDVANQDNFFKAYGKKQEFFIDELNKQGYLNRIDIGTEELVVYENENYKPHIYATKEQESIHWEVAYENIDFVQKNPTEYKIGLKNIDANKKIYLNFSESFHSDWKLRAGEFNWFNVLTQKKYFLPDEFHLKNNANLNTFKIDPNFIKENYPDFYTENPDGSINLEMVLYFYPQSFFYLGLLISGITLSGCIGYLLYDFKKRKRKKIS